MIVNDDGSEKKKLMIAKTMGKYLYIMVGKEPLHLSNMGKRQVDNYPTSRCLSSREALSN